MWEERTVSLEWNRGKAAHVSASCAVVVLGVYCSNSAVGFNTGSEVNTALGHIPGSWRVWVDVVGVYFWVIRLGIEQLWASVSLRSGTYWRLACFCYESRNPKALNPKP